MTTEANSAKAVAVLSGVAVGILTFAGLNIWFGIPFIPKTEDLPTVLKEPPPSAALAAAPQGPTDPGEQVFQTVCAACHQANAEGVPGAFPPLAGSEWVAADPETPIRIVLEGLTGPVQVKGTTFNSLMPPPPGLDDDKIAAVLTFVRSHFGNKGSAVSKEQVAGVRSALASRAKKSWTADELTALRPAGGGKDNAPGTGAAEAAPAATGNSPAVNAAATGKSPSAKRVGSARTRAAKSAASGDAPAAQP
jgi:mono/diheme cytochrome c family protein